jgi:hypothetical protein
MTEKDPQILNRAKKKALQSICKFQIAALGFNKRGECVIIKTNRPRFGGRGGGLHAEILVMNEAKKYGIVRILICRVGKGGEVRPIEPCDNCAKIAAKLGIKINSVLSESEKHEED